MDTTCVVNHPFTSVAEEARRPGVISNILSILLEMPQLPKTVRLVDRILCVILRPQGTYISCVVQYPRGQVFVSSPQHRSVLEGLLKSGQRTSTKTASFSPERADETQDSVVLSPPINLFATYTLQRDG